MKQLMLGVILTMAPLATTLPALGQAPAAPAPAEKAKSGVPQIRFSETVFDFGKINASDVAVHNFTVTNVGDALLEVTAVNPGCGCTTAGEWDRKIQPGQTGKIPIQFNPANFNGRITNKYVSVTCNDPAKPNNTLYLQATIWRPIELQPASMLYFMAIEGETTNETKTIRIISNLSEPITLEPPQCANPAFKMDLKTLQPGKEFELRVAYAPETTNAIPSGMINIKTSTTNAPVLQVTAYVMLQPALVAMPAQIQLPATASAVGYRHSAVIQNRSSLPVKLSDVAVNAEGVTVTVNETQSNKLFTLHMDIPANFQVRPGLELTAKTTHPKYPVFHIPIVPPLAQPPPITQPPVRPSAGGSK